MKDCDRININQSKIDPMNPNQHTLSKRLFLQAIELPANEVLVYITSQTQDEKVIQQVVELVKTYQTNTQYTHDFVADIAENISKSPLLFPSERYVLIKKIGQGGMGDVYLAQRKIKDIKQKVAIKILQLSDSLSKNRFSQEASILSQLSHPNISQFIDADFLSDGRPYVVMEYAEGNSITEYCQSNNLDIKARLGLFKSLCKAVEHAHRNLIIHRDIKPENIMVNEQGELMLLDFGIAKIIQDSDDHTRTQMHAMTPAYASPEQFMGKPVSVASDVYSLGVLLYELLTDSRPNEPKDHSPVEFENLLKTTIPIKPSLKVQQKWKSTLVGDLDKITLKALQFDVSQRYQTVAELFDDLNRYHNNLPVLAQTPSIGYRTNKFIKRNKLLVFTGVFVIGFVSIFMIIIFQQNIAIKKQADELVVQRDQAQREQKRAETLSETFVEAFKMADLTKTEGEIISAKDILDESTKLIQAKNFDDIQLTSQLIISIAEANRHISDEQQSLSLIQSIERNIEQLDVPTRDRINYEKAMSLFALDKTDQAISILKTIQSLSPIYNTAQLSLGRLYISKGDNETAEKILSPLFKAVDYSDPLYLSICNRLGFLLYGMGKHEEMETITFKCKYDLDNNIINASIFAQEKIYRLLSRLYSIKNNFELVVLNRIESLELNKQIFGVDHLETGSSYINLASAYTSLEDYEQAESNLLKGLEIYKQTLGENSYKIAYPYLTLAGIYTMTNRRETATEYYLKAINSFERNGLENHKNISFFYNELARNYIDLEQYNKAVDALLRCSEIFNSSAFEERYRYHAAQILLVKSYLKLNKRDKAKHLFQQSYPYVIEKFDSKDGDWEEEIWILAHELEQVLKE